MSRELEYRGVRDAFAPPEQQPYGSHRPMQADMRPSMRRTPLQEDDDNWRAAGDEVDPAAPLGTLIIVDTGVIAPNQVTVEGHRWIQQADRVLFLGADPVAERWLNVLNKNVEQLHRLETADEIIERTTSHLQLGLTVCLVLHGQSALHAQVRRAAIALGDGDIPVEAVPALSPLNCLISDLGIDPLRDGCQIFAAERFVELQRRPDTSNALILSLCEDTACQELTSILRAGYGPDHVVTLYEPSRYALLDPVVLARSLSQLDDAVLQDVSYIYVPPKSADD